MRKDCLAGTLIIVALPLDVLAQVEVPIKTRSAADQDLPVLATIYRREGSAIQEFVTRPDGTWSYFEVQCTNEIQYSAQPRQTTSYPRQPANDWRTCDSDHPIVFYFHPARPANLNIQHSWAFPAIEGAVPFDESFVADHPMINVAHVPTGSLAELRAAAHVGQQSTDLVNVGATEAQQLCDEGITLALDPDVMLRWAPDNTPPTEDFLSGTLEQDCFVATGALATVLTFMPETTNPESVAAFFDLEQFPGLRAIPSYFPGIFAWALYADGVHPSEISDMLASEEGLERAIERVEPLRHELLQVPEGEELDLLRTGEVTFAVTSHMAVFEAEVAGDEPVEILWDGQLVEWSGWSLVSGSAEIEAALTYLYAVTDSEALATLAQDTALGPARFSALEVVGEHPDVVRYLPTAPERYESAIVLDADFAGGDWFRLQDALTDIILP